MKRTRRNHYDAQLRAEMASALNWRRALLDHRSRIASELRDIANCADQTLRLASFSLGNNLVRNRTR